MNTVLVLDENSIAQLNNACMLAPFGQIAPLIAKIQEQVNTQPQLIGLIYAQEKARQEEALTRKLREENVEQVRRDTAASALALAAAPKPNGSAPVAEAQPLS